MGNAGNLITDGYLPIYTRDTDGNLRVSVILDAGVVIALGSTSQELDYDPAVQTPNIVQVAMSLDVEVPLFPGKFSFTPVSVYADTDTPIEGFVWDGYPTAA